MAETAPEADANADATIPARPSNAAGFYMGDSGRKSSSNARINEILEVGAFFFISH
jgi:hypothetical protein